MQPIIFNPVGFCIYCGATRYSKNRATLGAEHIIAEGLGGKWVLPRASCARCESVTMKDEQIVARNHFGPARHELNIRSKKNRKRENSFAYVETPLGSRPSIRTLPFEQYPFPIRFVGFDGFPRIISGEPAPPLGPSVTTHLSMNERYFNNPFVRNSSARKIHVDIPLQPFTRMLAKIAHSYLYAILDNRAIEPLLNDLVLGRQWPDNNYLVGGEPNIGPVTPELHQLGWKIVDTKNRGRFVLVEIRLFSQLGGPLYRVAAGKIPGY